MEVPEGLFYHPEFITPDEEGSLAELLRRLEYTEVRMHGVVARRVVRHFGVDYAYESRQVISAEDLPSELEWLRFRCAELATLAPERLVEGLVNNYPPGAGIGWHRDAPMFGSKVVGVSLLAPCRMRFRRTVKGEKQVYVQELDRRSAYVLSGAARASWQHSIPPVKEHRYSITFRTLRSSRSNEKPLLRSTAAG